MTWLVANCSENQFLFVVLWLPMLTLAFVGWLIGVPMFYSWVGAIAAVALFWTAVAKFAGVRV